MTTPAVFGMPRIIRTYRHTSTLDQTRIDAVIGDDFNRGTLNPKWVRRNFTSSNETFQNSAILHLTLTGRTGGDGYLQAAPSGSDWKIMMTSSCASSSWQFWSIVALDSNGTGIGTFSAGTPSGVGLGTISTYTSYGGTFTLQSGSSSSTGASGRYWQYLRKSGTSYYQAYSTNGETWSAEITLTSSATINRVGMLIHPYAWSQGAVTTSSLVDIDLFNKIA